MEPHVEQAAYDLLDRAGYDVIPLSTMGAGAALLSKGFVEGARRQAVAFHDELQRIDPAGELSIVGVEPSEAYAIKHEYGGLLPEARRSDMATRVFKGLAFGGVRNSIVGFFRIAYSH